MFDCASTDSSPSSTPAARAAAFAVPPLSGSSDLCQKEEDGDGYMMKSEGVCCTELRGRLIHEK